MNDLERFYGPNAGYVLELYDRFREDPNSVDPETREIFSHWTPSVPQPDGPASTPSTPTTVSAPGVDISKVVAAARIARLVRELGHLTAHIDPLGNPPPGDLGLELSTHGLTTDDLKALPASVVGGPLAEGAPDALEALGRLRKVYSGPIGYEDDHIQIEEERVWIVDAIENRTFFRDITDATRIQVLERLTATEGFERYLQSTFGPAKRFSIEGNDMLIPMLDETIHAAAVAGTREIVMGMSHRGRLNVLAHILGKPYASILAEFESGKQDQSSAVSGGSAEGWTGDVKYHLGASVEYREEGSVAIPITLAPNPSHLEFVDPVVIGRARAAQEDRYTGRKPIQDATASLAILMHGDAAFPGQGIVAETLNLSQLKGYFVGGTIHFIVNNQIGFTTAPNDSRSTLYASDLAKGFEIPIVHVNADDVEACIAAVRMAYAYREKFGKDFLIDLVGYRRFGHNEGDEPTYTQPRMYEKINAHPTVRQIWAEELERRNVVTRDQHEEMVRKIQETLQAARNTPSGKGLSKGAPAVTPKPKLTGRVTADNLKELNDALFTRPTGFTVNAKLDRLLQRRRASVNEENAIEWMHAESLAFASILQEGIPIRLTGQDSQRGTFTTRHAVLHDPVTGDTFCPLQELPHNKASFVVYNSPLSENAAMGFEYGYSMHACNALVLWEGQFGDFVNGAQVIVDQFLVSGNAKWRQTPSLVLLLPHGYEGAGPEHSSGRVERFLQLAAGNHFTVVNCTTAAQYYHVLRRQASTLESNPRPLIVMSPKMLLRHPMAASSLSDLSDGNFQTVLDDASVNGRASSVTRVILCSGKVYVDLVSHKAYQAAENVATVRVEQLYPFPADELKRVLGTYTSLKEIVWLQEEPKNMGGWTFVDPYLREIAGKDITVQYVGRAASTSPAEGSARRHSVEQNRIVTAALSDVPNVK